MDEPNFESNTVIQLLINISTRSDMITLCQLVTLTIAQMVHMQYIMIVNTSILSTYHSNYKPCSTSSMLHIYISAFFGEI